MTLLRRSSSHSGGDLTSFQAAVFDEEVLRNALEQADIVPQLLTHTQLSGETDLLEQARPYIRGAWSFMQDIPASLAAVVRERLVRTLQKLASGQNSSVSDTSRELFGKLMSVGIGQPIPNDYVTMMLEEMNHQRE